MAQNLGNVNFHNYIQLKINDFALDTLSFIKVPKQLVPPQKRFAYNPKTQQKHLWEVCKVIIDVIRLYTRHSVH